MKLKNRRALVTGGSRGLGLGVVEALDQAGAGVTVVARNPDDLSSVSAKLGVETVAADVTDRESARLLLAQVRPEILILNAGAVPAMRPLEEQTWESFSQNWETDVKAGLFWIQAALQLPLPSASRVLLFSSGAAISGSPLSGGYAGAKKMLWFLASYANASAQERRLGIRFQTIVPQQMIADTGVGGAGASAYSKRLDVPVEQFLSRFGAPLPPGRLGNLVVEILTRPDYQEQLAFGLKGDSGITVLEG